MEPANILFIIAFIGIPIAFGVWALVSRRELQRMPPPPPRKQPPSTDTSGQEPEKGPAPPQPPPAHPAHSVDAGTRQMPATQREPDAASQETRQQAPPPEAQRTRQIAAAPPQAASPLPQQFGFHPPSDDASADSRPSPQDTEELPAIEVDQQSQPIPVAPQAPQAQPSNENQAERTSGSSGTTEEFPVVGYTEIEPLSPDPDQTAGMPAQPPEQPEVPAAPAPTPSPAPPRRGGLIVRRPFYAPRYSGKSRGVVKRMSPHGERRFLAPKEESRPGR